ncbi:hypothetical protein D3C71_1661110 [compost metagenome]
MLDQRLERRRIPLAFSRQGLLDHIQIQSTGQIPQALGQTHHGQVVDFGKARLAARRQRQQLTLEPRQVALDLRLVGR